MKKSWLAFSLAGLFGIGFLLPSLTLGSEIGAGFDLFETKYEPPKQTEIILPGIGQVILIGNSAPLASEDLGNTDTIVKRIDGIDPFVQGDLEKTINIELVVLSLKSIESFDLGKLNPVDPIPNGTMADLYVVINKLELPGLPTTNGILTTPSVGKMIINHENADGEESQGTFTANLPQIQTLLIFVTAGGELGNPTDELLSIVDPTTPLPSLESTGNWTHKKPVGVRKHSNYPAGKFYIADIVHKGPHHPDGPVPVIFDQPLTATLLSDNTVSLTWVTGMEEFMAGFVTYRGELKNEAGVCTDNVNDYTAITMISWEDSQVGGSNGGASYSVIDPDGKSNSCYGLFAIGFDGTRELQLTKVSK